MMKPQTGELVFFWILFGIAGLLTFSIMSPYLTPLFLAGVFTILFSPIHKRMLAWTKGNETLASLATVLLVLCVILIPLIFLGIVMFQEVLTIYGTLSQGNMTFTAIDKFISLIEVQARHIIPTFEIHANVYVYIEGALRWVASHLNTFFLGIFSAIFQIFIIIVAMFFFYRDGARLHAFALKWSPLDDSERCSYYRHCSRGSDGDWIYNFWCS
jgi:predicted PurR-regulated permease PerM